MKWKPLITPLALAGGVLVSACCCLGPAIVYPAPSVDVPQTPPLPLKAVTLPSGCVAWVQDPRKDHPVIVWCHGNGENLETMRQASMYTDFGRLGYGVVAMDYPGYGNSAGRPDEEGARQSVIESVALARRRWLDHPVVLAGWSIGTGVAMSALPDCEIDGLVLASPFTSLADAGRVHYPAWIVALLTPDDYDSRSRAREVGVPTLIVHGSADPLIPVGQGRDLSREISGSRFVELPGTGHVVVADPRFWRSLAEFTRTLR